MIRTVAVVAVVAGVGGCMPDMPPPVSTRAEQEERIELARQSRAIGQAAVEEHGPVCSALGYWRWHDGWRECVLRLHLDRPETAVGRSNRYDQWRFEYCKNLELTGPALTKCVDRTRGRL